MNELRPGLRGKIGFKVERHHLAEEVKSGAVKVFATPMLIAGMEMAAVEALRTALAPEDTTVGTEVNVRHLAATPPGLAVTFEATLTEVTNDGKVLVFAVEAYDDVGPIGAGTHKRMLVNRKKFEERAFSKLRCGG